MAKSPLDLRGAKARNLRLDVELLARGLAYLRSSGYQAVGYLLVLTDDVARRARGWDVVANDPQLEVVIAELSDDDFEAVRVEKIRNAAGTASGNPTDSIAHLGQSLAEQALHDAINARHPGVQRSFDPPPLNVRWDFFGVAPAE